MFKKSAALLLVVLIVAAVFAGCQSQPANEAPQQENNEATAEPAAPKEFEFTRKIEIVVPWGAGGGADSTARAFGKALEKEIGVPVVINNKSGAGGITGVEYAVSQPTDGYTWFISTPSPLLAQITGATDFDVYGSSIPVTKLVHDVNIFVTGANSPFSNYQELSDYIDANPGVIKCGVMSITGLDGASVSTAFGGRVEAVAYTEGAQLNSDIIGGHIQLACVGPAEVLGMLQSGDMKAVLACVEQKLTLPELADVDVTGELGIDSFFGPARGIFAAKGMPQEAIDAFAAAAEKAHKSEEFQTWVKSQGLDQRPGYAGPEEYKKLWDNDYNKLSGLFKK